jgi:hypothetical protein
LVTPQARQIAWALAEHKPPVRFLDSQSRCPFPVSFDRVFEAPQGFRIIRTPVQTPEANGIAERFGLKRGPVGNRRQSRGATALAAC